MKLSSTLQLLQVLTEIFIQFIPNSLQFIQQNEKLEGKILMKEIVICLSSLMKLIITTSIIISLIKLNITSIIEYLKINNPHKTSLYLACGIPVVIWSQAALADFIIQNKCGITVENIKDIENKLSSLSGDEYNTIKKNAEKIGMLLREGYYTKQAVKNCVS